MWNGDFNDDNKMGHLKHVLIECTLIYVCVVGTFITRTILIMVRVAKKKLKSC